MKTLLLLLTFFWVQLSFTQSLVINEVAQGLVGNEEFVELLVIPDPSQTILCTEILPCLDLRGWIFDDNNGYFSGGPQAGVGIAAGACRFSMDIVWSCVPVGTIITIYNDAELTGPGNDESLIDGDCDMVIPISSSLFDRAASPLLPNTSSSSYTTNWVSGGDWNQISLANDDDSFQIYDPSDLTAPVHAVSWGAGAGANDQNTIIYFAQGTTDDVMSAENSVDCDFSNQANWNLLSNVVSPTMGTYNSIDNQNCIEALNNNCFNPMIASAISTDEDCSCDATLYAEDPILGTPLTIGSDGVYTYEWFDNGAPFISIGTGPIITNICPGVYNLIVTSGTGCIDTATVTVAPSLTSFVIDSTATVNGTNCAVYMTYCSETGTGDGNGTSNTGAFGLLTFGGATVDFSPTQEGSAIDPVTGSGTIYSGNDAFVAPFQALINTPYPTATGLISYFDDDPPFPFGTGSFDWFACNDVAGLNDCGADQLSCNQIMMEFTSLPDSIMLVGIEGAFSTVSDLVNALNGNTGCEQIVYPPVDGASFTMTPNCGGGTATLNSTTGGTFSFNPDLGDGAVIDPVTGTVTNVVTGTTYDILYTTSGSCASNATQQLTSVSGTTNIVVSNPGPFCEGAPISVTETGGDAISWSWSSNGLANFSNANDQTPTVTNAVNGEIFTVNIIDASGCSTSGQTALVINPNPIIDPITDVVICDSYVLPAIAGTNITVGATYYDATGGPSGTGTAYSVGSTINFADFVSYPVALYAYDEVGACSDEEPFSLTINQTPIIDPIGPLVECDSVQLPSITGTLSGNEGYFSLTGGLGTTFNVGDWITASTSIFIYDETITTPNCFAEEILDITINTALITDNAPVCVGQTVTLTGSGTPNVTNPWVSGTPATATVDDFGVVTGVAAGTTIITYTDANSCTDTVLVTVNALPSVNIPLVTPVCENVAITLNETGGDGTSWLWSSDGLATITSTNSQSPVITNGVDGETFEVIVTDANGCVDSLEVSITVNPLPVIEATPTDPLACNGTDGFIDVVLNPISTSTGTLSWTGGAIGSNPLADITADSPDISSLMAGSYNVTFTDDNGCVSNIEAVLLNNPGAPVLDLITDTTSCGVDFVLDVNDITGTTTGSQAYYDAGVLGANVIADLTVFDATNTPATIFAIDSNGVCASIVSFTVTVNPIPTVDVTADQALCANALTSAVTFTGNNAGTTYDWVNDDITTGLIASGSGDIAPFTATNATGSAIVSTVTVTPTLNGCTGVADVFTITVDPIPTVDATADQALCANASTTAVTFTGNNAGTTYNWVNDDITTGLAVSGSGDIASFTATNATGSAIVSTVTVTPTLNGVYRCCGCFHNHS